MISARPHIRTALVAATSLAAVVGLGARGSAQDPGPAWTVSPEVVADGDQLVASGTGCLNPDTSDNTDMSVIVELPGLAYPRAGAPETPYVLATVEADGSWTVTAEVDTREATFGPFDDFTTTITAACLRDLAPVFTYDATFEIRYDGTADDASTTSTTQPSTPTAPPSPAPAPAPAPVLPGRADYTG